MERSREAHGRFWSLLSWFAIALFLYALTTGPAVRLVQAGYLSERAMKVIYTPLAAVAPEHTPQNDFLFWYIFTAWKADFPPLK